MSPDRRAEIYSLLQNLPESKDQVILELMPDVRLIAFKHARRWPHLKDDLLSQAYYVLTYEIARFCESPPDEDWHKILFRRVSVAMWHLPRSERLHSCKRRTTSGLHPEIATYTVPSPLDYVDLYAAIDVAVRDEMDRVIIDTSMRGYLNKEIAAMIGISPSRVSRRLSGIHQRIRKYYDVNNDRP